MGALVALALTAAALLVGLRLARPGVLPRVHLGDVAVGGLDETRLRATVERLAQRRAAETVSATLADQAATATNAELGYILDVDATVRRALSRGRQSNPLVALADHLRAFAATTVVEPVERVDDAGLEAWAARVAESLVVAPAEGTLVFDGASVERVDPRPGARLRVEPLVAEARSAVLRPGDDVVETASDPVAPATAAADVDAVLAQARQALSAPVRLSRNDGSFQFEPAHIGRVLEVRQEPAEAGDGSGDGAVELRLSVDPRRLAEVIPPAT
ncbi:MAG TPA: peptidoglycan binding domain-containing protein, partial [Egibacteraceae bacterium]|nr:peptidoglycan binding domain-containing protein [Egibacteraceae bacterium]